MAKQTKLNAALPGSLPSVQLTEEQASDLSTELGHFEQLYDIKPHPLQAQAIAFNIWDYNDDENFQCAIENHLDVIETLVNTMAPPSHWGHEKTARNIRMLLKQVRLFMQLQQLPALQH